ncbi:hypothetical protein FRC03_007097 [Tulasnella sp. 419]|nr:hypothetical protein FRC03_007097 [Tulasnella sp. 419]
MWNDGNAVVAARLELGQKSALVALKARMSSVDTGVLAIYEAGYYGIEIDITL